MKKYLNYLRLLILGIFVFILLMQQFDFYNQYVDTWKHIIVGDDFITKRDHLYDSLKKTLPSGGVYHFVYEHYTNPTEYNMYYFIAEYSLVPRLLTDSLPTDTVIGYFDRTLSINNPQNPLYETRNDWTVLKDNGAGIELLKKNKP